MLRATKYIFLVLAIFYWAISHFQTLYGWAGKNKLYPDDYRYGDLYRLSFLPKFKELDKKCPVFIDKKEKNNNVHLYILGDSFTDESNINSENYAAGNYTYIHWDKPQKIKLDSSKKNILILESVERSMKMHFTKVSNEIRMSQNTQPTEHKNFGVFSALQSWIDTFSNNTQKTEERLWHTLLNYDIVLYFKELKAELDLKLFDRKSPNYNLSPEKSEIFYFEEAAIECPNSAFFQVSNTEIDGFVDIANQNFLKYQKMGFNVVYLSLIPNKVSILAPEMGVYNHVLERVQSHPNLKIPFIDTYSIFKKQSAKFYAKSDTHWNCEGAGIWQKMVNDLVK